MRLIDPIVRDAEPEDIGQQWTRAERVNGRRLVAALYLAAVVLVVIAWVHA